jgi:phosphoribosylamine--glycine ligase
MAEGRLSPPAFEDAHTVVKYLVPEGYPEKPLKDAQVEVDGIGMENCGAKVYYASVYESGGKIFTTSSRAFAILGKAETLTEAEKIAENGCGNIRGPVWHRKDIGTAKLVEKRVAHMRSMRGDGKWGS